MNLIFENSCDFVNQLDLKHFTDITVFKTDLRKNAGINLHNINRREDE